MKLVVEVPPEGVVADLPQSHTPMHRGMRHPRKQLDACAARASLHRTDYRLRACGVSASPLRLSHVEQKTQN